MGNWIQNNRNATSFFGNLEFTWSCFHAFFFGVSLSLANLQGSKHPSLFPFEAFSPIYMQNVSRTEEQQQRQQQQQQQQQQQCSSMTQQQNGDVNNKRSMRETLPVCLLGRKMTKYLRICNELPSNSRCLTKIAKQHPLHEQILKIEVSFLHSRTKLNRGYPKTDKSTALVRTSRFPTSLPLLVI